MSTFLLFALFFLFSSCGVKLPPVAPEQSEQPPSLNLNCSPQDPDCDATDPNYKPRGGK